MWADHRPPRGESVTRAFFELNTELKMIEIATARKQKADEEERRMAETIQRQEAWEAQLRTQRRKTGRTSTSRSSSYSSSNRQ